jgi:predicted esterase
MSRSQLAYRIAAPEQQPERATVIPLHRYNGSREDLIPLARSLGPRTRVVAPEALNGVFEGRRITGHMWYRIQEVGHPEPGSFGDSLWQLEQFIYDVVEELPGATMRPVLLGHDQGGVLALTLALVIPDYLAGVISIRGYLPDVLGWPIDAREMNNLPVLLIRDPEETSFPYSLTDEAARRLSAHGARVSVRAVPGAHALGPTLSPVLTRWVCARTHGLRA